MNKNYTENKCKNEILKAVSEYLLSFSFIWFMVYSIFYFNIFQKLNFANTYLLVIIDMIATILLFVVKQKGIRSDFPKPVIKLFLLLIVMVIIAVFCYLSGKSMNFSNGSTFAMNFLTLMYFELYWEGGPKCIESNWNNIKMTTKNDKLFEKISFYVFLSIILLYQVYVLGVFLIDIFKYFF